MFKSMKCDIKRAARCFSPALHRPHCVKAAQTERSISGLVNDPVQLSLVEDAGDVVAFEATMREPVLPYRDVVDDLH